MSARSGLRGWLDERWAGPARMRAFLSKPLPRNIGWLHTLGALLLFYLGFQTLTGILLAFYYSPSPDAAYESMLYIREELWLGAFLHRLHRYGAGFVMVAAFLHMARSYFLGAYKRPRELLWVTGLLLGVLLTLFAFTGQLLPWDQRGYWATVVGIEIASSAPGAGEGVRKLLTGGYGDIGGVTLSRFYILHVCVLPLALAGLAAVHLKILQKTGPAGPLSGSPEPTRPFFPGQALRDLTVAAGGALALVAVAALVPMTETGPADPKPGGYTPRPEWYFLAHYELLKYVPPLIGAFVLPNVALAFLLFVPWLDRGASRALRDRRVIVGIGAAGTIALVVLTSMALAGLPDEEDTGSDSEDTDDPVARGRTLVTETRDCRQCHTVAGQGGTQGPPLHDVGQRLQRDYLEAWLRDPKRFRPQTTMPAFEGTEEELRAVVAYLMSLD